MKEVCIIDTGENYIIGLKNEALDCAKELYAMIDIVITETPTGILVPKDILEFVHQSIGRVISYGFGDTDASTRIDIPGKLMEDIKKVVEFSKIKAFWENIKYKNGEVGEVKVEKESSNKPSNLLIGNGGNLKYMLIGDTDMSRIETPPLIKNYIPTVYVIYNSLYNITLVVDNRIIGNMKELTDNFPDFVKVYEYILPIDKTLDHDDVVEYKRMLEKLFHKVTYDSVQDVNKKMEAFKLLYADDITCDKNEKAKVIDYLHMNYDISNDPVKRVKANDLYKEFINYILVPYENAAAFKKRLAGYLLEAGLQKKRFSDAYYYYGLSKKDYTTMTLDQIEEKRNKDIRTYYSVNSSAVKLEEKAALARMSLQDLEEMRKRVTDAIGTVQ